MVRCQLHDGLRGRRRQRLAAGLGGRDGVDDRLVASVRLAIAAHGEPIRHHDEQPPFVDERELSAEEACIRLRLLPTLVDGAQVVGPADQRDSDLVSARFRLAHGALELGLVRRGNVVVLRDELSTARGASRSPGRRPRERAAPA